LKGRKWIAGLVLLLALGLAYRIAIGVMIARAVLPPHSTRTQVLMALVRPPYQMAAPHYKLLKEARRLFTPSVVHAQIYCGTSPCAFMKSILSCPPYCVGTGYCNCPACATGNCRWYACITSSNQSDICDASAKYWGCGDACSGTGACTIK